MLTAAVLVTYALDELAAHPITAETGGLVLIAVGVALATVAALWPRPGPVEQLV